jgi:hypothetical protein
MSIQIDCEVDLSPTPLNVTLLPASEIGVAWPPPGTVNARLVPSPSVNVSYLPASPIDVTLLPSSSFDVALLPPANISIIRGTDVMGPPGPPGPTGPTGPPGPQGQGIVIKGTVATHANLPTTGNAVGDMWITADTGHGWVWQANLTWLDAGPIQGPPGPPGASAASKTVCGETPIGAINGTNLNYASANPYSPGLLSVYLNGLRLRRSADYNETGSQSFQFLSAPLPGDSLSIDYIQP